MRPYRLGCLFGLLAAACSDDMAGPSTTPPVTPTRTATPTPTPSFTLSGTVYEHTPTGARPLADVPLDISVEYQSWPPKLRTDADGRYSYPGATGALKVKADLEGYSQPCRAGAVIDRDTMLDVHVVSNAVLSASGIPPSMPVVDARITGRVMERTPDGRVVWIPGASVIGDFTGGNGWAPSATTVSDASGMFILCGVSNASGLGLVLYVSKPGYESAEQGVDYTLARTNYDVELLRK